MRGARTRPAAAALAVAALAALPAAAQAQVAEYRASYEVSHNGRRAANAEFSVVAAGDAEYVYTSTTEARGLLSLVVPGPATERSRLRLSGNRPVSIQFDYVDGSRKGEDNFSLAFDPATAEVRITRADSADTLPLEPDLLDRGSLQVALLLDLASCSFPGPYRWVDEDGIKTYRYLRLDDAQAETIAGKFPTVRFSQQREGSSRESILWLAPELSFVPVYVEQIDNGKMETVYSLKDIEIITPQTAQCSGFG
jgi:hypothetical protein